MKSLGIKEQVAHHPTTSRSNLVSRRWMDEVTWRINQLSKWLANGVISHLELDQPYLGDLLTIVINHLPSGTILQTYFPNQSQPQETHQTNQPRRRRKSSWKITSNKTKAFLQLLGDVWVKKSDQFSRILIEFTRRKSCVAFLCFVHLMSWVAVFWCHAGVTLVSNLKWTPLAPWDGNTYLHFPLNVAIFHLMT